MIPVAFAYGVLGFAIRHNQVKPEFTILGAVEETAARLVGLTGPFEISHGFGTGSRPRSPSSASAS